MKTATVGALLVCFVHAAEAQSLDIGGVELRLGQKVDEALRSMSSYTVTYAGDSWFVSQKFGSRYQFLGTLGARANILTFISKHFDMDDNEDTPGALTRASREVRRRGGTTCTTREVEYSDGLVGEFETSCGRYKLSYILPRKGSDGQRVLGGVSISIKSP